MAIEKEITLSLILSYDEYTGHTTATCIRIDKETNKELSRDIIRFENQTIAETEARIMEKMKRYLDNGGLYNYSRTEMKH